VSIIAIYHIEALDQIIVQNSERTKKNNEKPSQKYLGVMSKANIISFS